MKEILILENNQQELDNLVIWVQEAADRAGVPIEITPIRRDFKEEFETWLDDYFGDPRNAAFDLTIMDVIFKVRAGVKQDFGGVQLWGSIMRKKPIGYDASLG